MIISSQILDVIGNAALILNPKGEIVKANPAFLFSLNNLTEGKLNIENIRELDPYFEPDEIERGVFFHKQLTLGNLSFGVKAFKVDYEGLPCFLYIFENTITTSKELNELLDIIDDGILIVNKSGIIEAVNSSVLRFLGLEKVEYLIGRKVTDFHFTLTSEPISLRVLREKRPVHMYVDSKNGRSLISSGFPILDEGGEIIRVVVISRDITELINLTAKLDEVTRDNSRYLAALQELELYAPKELIYSSDKMLNIVERAIRVAPTDSPAFITGESGVGKEMIAKLIHRASLRKDKPYVAINCAAIPPELIESELFGYEEGAFTGAIKGGKRGLLHEANGGTLFLDELGEIPLEKQSKILRVIQESEFMPIGGKHNIPIDIRYIAATNLTQEEIFDNRKLRQDLYYRLSVVPIHIPPLRERKEDIMPLIWHYLKLYNQKYDLNVSLSGEAIKALYEYEWPGNVRELKNVIERLVILSEQDLVNVAELIEIGNLSQKGVTSKGITINNISSLKEAQLLLEDIMINQAIKEHGSIVKAAEALQINPSTIYRKINKGELVVQDD